VDGRPVAGEKDLPDDLETGLQVETRAHDDMVDVRPSSSTFLVMLIPRCLGGTD
jgi:hypothetical protein